MRTYKRKTYKKGGYIHSATAKKTTTKARTRVRNRRNDQPSPKSNYVFVNDKKTKSNYVA